MVPCQRVKGIATPLTPQVYGDPGYDPRVYRLIPHNGDPTRKPATLIFLKSAKKTDNRRAKNGVDQFANRAFFKHLVAATSGKHKPYEETGMWREFSIEHLGGGVWAQRDFCRLATFLLPTGTCFRDWAAAGWFGRVSTQHRLRAGWLWRLGA